MTEAHVVLPLLPEVERMQAWIEQEVIEKKTCPPLVKLAQRYKDEQNNLDWNRLATEVDLRSYRHLSTSRDLLLATVVNDYVQYIAKEIQGTSPMTQVFILPDFTSNDEFNTFMEDVKKTTFKRLRSTPEGIATAREAFAKAAEIQNIPQTQTLPLLNQGQRRQGVIVKELIEGPYNPIVFYGNALTDNDLNGFNTDRGPRERQKILSRAPYYSFQLVSAFRGLELSETLNTSKLYARNTQLVMGTSLPLFEARIHKLRK